jgi:Zn-finger protein
MTLMIGIWMFLVADGGGQAPEQQQSNGNNTTPTYKHSGSSSAVSVFCFCQLYFFQDSQGNLERRHYLYSVMM